jgi:hypothetical protein
MRDRDDDRDEHGRSLPSLPARENQPKGWTAPTWIALTQGLARTIPRVARRGVMPLRAWPGQTTRYLTEVLMKRLAITAAALAALALPSLAQAQTPPLPPGEPPASGPPPGLDPPAPGPPALPGVPPTSPEATPAPAPGEAPASAPASQARRSAGKVASIALNGRTLVVKVACTAEAHAKLQLTSRSVSIGQRRYQCSGTRTFELRAPHAVVRRAHRKGGADVQARVSATGFESNLVRVRVRTHPVARAAAVALASQNRIPCGWCTEYIFGGFGNQQTLEYWVRQSDWLKWGNWYVRWRTAQYYQNYASAYVTTYRYWWYWNGSTEVYYYVEDIGP